MSKNLHKLIIIFLLSNSLVFGNLINGFYFSNTQNKTTTYINNGVSQSKQTVLSSITGNEVKCNI